MTSAPTFPDETPDNNPVDWDLRVLDTPVVLDIPDTLPDQPDPLLLAAVEVLVAALLGDHGAARRIGELARSGVVALRTSAGCLELHETLLGWTLTRTWGEPDAPDLAAAARLRARRLATERRSGCGPLE